MCGGRSPQVFAITFRALYVKDGQIAVILVPLHGSASRARRRDSHVRNSGPTSLVFGSVPADEGPSELLNTYLKKREDLVRFFTLRLGARVEAEDLVQEIYFKIVNGSEAPDIKSPSAYLYRIGSNLLIDRVRGQMRSARRERDWYGINRVVSGGQDVADQPSAEAALDAKQRLAKVLKAVDELPPQCRRAFRLHKFDGFSHAEVSQMLGISRSAVEKHISAALKSLTRKLA